jgi:hypothetical protein
MSNSKEDTEESSLKFKLTIDYGVASYKDKFDSPSDYLSASDELKSVNNKKISQICFSPDRLQRREL